MFKDLAQSPTAQSTGQRGHTGRQRNEGQEKESKEAKGEVRTKVNTMQPVPFTFGQFVEEIPRGQDQEEIDRLQDWWPRTEAREHRLWNHPPGCEYGSAT